MRILRKITFVFKNQSHYSGVQGQRVNLFILLFASPHSAQLMVKTSFKPDPRSKPVSSEFIVQLQLPKHMYKGCTDMLIQSMPHV